MKTIKSNKESAESIEKELTEISERYDMSMEKLCHVAILLTWRNKGFGFKK